MKWEDRKGLTQNSENELLFPSNFQAKRNLIKSGSFGIIISAQNVFLFCVCIVVDT